MNDAQEQPGETSAWADRRTGSPNSARPVQREQVERPWKVLLSQPYSAATLWEVTRSCFEHDDGSLPEVGLGNLSSKQIEVIVSEILAQSGSPTGNPTLTLNDEGQAPNASSLEEMVEAVREGHAVNVCFGLTDLTHERVRLPEIVVCVWRDSVTLEYRQGPGWTLDSVEALFSLLRSLHAMSPQAQLECECEVTEPEAFRAGWIYYLKYHPLIQC